ncbi:hypothetical protein THIOKS13330021 [Thiocapsa sp. KS1]|nr:hypothetical protein THIOKS13330021 [Thiocapsa sp. KS1]
MYEKSRRLRVTLFGSESGAHERDLAAGVPIEEGSVFACVGWGQALRLHELAETIRGRRRSARRAINTRIAADAVSTRHGGW